MAELSTLTNFGIVGCYFIFFLYVQKINSKIELELQECRMRIRVLEKELFNE